MIQVNLSDMLKMRKMKLKDLAEAVGMTMTNLSIIKTGRAKSIRFSTLESICRVFDCQPGYILLYSKKQQN